MGMPSTFEAVPWTYANDGSSGLDDVVWSDDVSALFVEDGNDDDSTPSPAPGGGGSGGEDGGGSDEGSSPPVGAIAGGVVGGVAGIALIGALVWFLLRRRRRREAAYSPGTEVGTLTSSTPDANNSKKMETPPPAELHPETTPRSEVAWNVYEMPSNNARAELSAWKQT